MQERTSSRVCVTSYVRKLIAALFGSNGRTYRKERDAWASRVNELLVWIEVDDNSSVLDATSFFDAVNRGVV